MALVSIDKMSTLILYWRKVLAFQFRVTSDLFVFCQEEQDREINGTRRYPNGTALYFPTNSSVVDNILEHNPTIYNSSVISQDFNSTIEVSTLCKMMWRAFSCLWYWQKFPLIFLPISETINRPVELPVIFLHIFYFLRQPYRSGYTMGFSQETRVGRKISCLTDSTLYLVNPKPQKQLL